MSPPPEDLRVNDSEDLPPPRSGVPARLSTVLQFDFWKAEWKHFLWACGLFCAIFFMPWEMVRVQNALQEAVALAQWYAREHVLLCLIPAFFIAGGISVFVRHEAVMQYLGPQARKAVSYGVSAVSGSLLAVCSCTVLPLFAGIYRMGAGLGPACAFLYSGPAINVLAIILTARILGPQMGTARAVGAVLFSIVIGLLMHFIFRKDEVERANLKAVPQTDDQGRPLWRNAFLFGTLTAILVFATWAEPETSAGPWQVIASVKWPLTAFASAVLGIILVRWLAVPWAAVLLASLTVLGVALLAPEQPAWAFVTGLIAFSILTSTHRGEAGEWFSASWDFARQILPLLLIGVLAAGALLGRPGHEALIPSSWVADTVGGNSLAANFFASLAGAFMYFATLTEIPIIQGLLGSGMGKGPALALLLAGPALSLPNMLVIRSVMGTRKTVVFVALVVAMATLSGMLYGLFAD